MVAIQGIAKSIEQINEIGASIASAMEQQGAATKEISRNVQEAAAGTQGVSATIVNVNQSATRAGEASGAMLKAAGDLSQEAEILRRDVDAYLHRLGAA